MTNPIPGDIKIKDFGRDRKFRSVDELQSTLSEQYKGQHVSIVYPAKPSVYSARFLSVSMMLVA
ncbi:Uncharacterised protein [Klebsiella pneumoniae]|uniref:Uncharacterized protein n=1 Tax=Klebsiella pneumoniae TaxID=573 RepID=A0A377USK5_KLEPN|nr:Uncharacterised protein [Klebsiella pneumoniae]